MSAAMASLLDAEFEIPRLGAWTNPSGEEWTITFDVPMLGPAVREVFQVADRGRQEPEGGLARPRKRRRRQKTRKGKKSRKSKKTSYFFR